MSRVFAIFFSSRFVSSYLSEILESLVRNSVLTSKASANFLIISGLDPVVYPRSKFEMTCPDTPTIFPRSDCRKCLFERASFNLAPKLILSPPDKSILTYNNEKRYLLTEYFKNVLTLTENDNIIQI